MRIDMLIGISGSGKTTFAEEYLDIFLNRGEKAYLFSSDAIREELYGDEAVQKNPAEVFSIMHQRMHEAIQNGADEIIYDATNIKKSDRKKFFDEFGDNEIYAIVFETALETALKQNASRYRIVPEEVIRRQYQTLQNNPVSINEGFAGIMVKRDGHFVIEH